MRATGIVTYSVLILLTLMPLTGSIAHARTADDGITNITVRESQPATHEHMVSNPAPEKTRHWWNPFSYLRKGKQEATVPEKLPLPEPQM